MKVGCNALELWKPCKFTKFCLFPVQFNHRSNIHLETYSTRDNRWFSFQQAKFCLKMFTLEKLLQLKPRRRRKKDETQLKHEICLSTQVAARKLLFFSVVWQITFHFIFSFLTSWFFDINDISISAPLVIGDDDTDLIWEGFFSVAIFTYLILFLFLFMGQKFKIMRHVFYK